MQIDNGPLLRSTREALGLSQAKLSELTGISQHVLSAFELEKATPDPSTLARVSEVLLDRSHVERVVGRRKRYRAHTYEVIAHDPERVARHVPTGGNSEYVELIDALHNDRLKSEHRALSLFAGCGGMSLGFTWAGFVVQGFLELDDGFRSIYSDNFPHAAEIGGDISALADAEIEATKGVVGEVDVIIGGPPCQGFSLSGKRSVTDPRNTLFLDYLRFVDVYRPKIAIMENVRLLTSMKSPHGGLVRDEIKEEFRTRGYRVEMFEANAKYFGVPQHRERIFFLATRNDLSVEPSFPNQTHGQDAGDLFSDRRPCRTFGDACSDLCFIESGEGPHRIFGGRSSPPR